MVNLPLMYEGISDDEELSDHSPQEGARGEEDDDEESQFPGRDRKNRTKTMMIFHLMMGTFDSIIM